MDLKEIPMTYGQVLPYTPALGKFKFREQIREQMANANMDSGKPESITNARMVSTDGFPLKGDHVHYNAQGQIMLGKALAKGLLQASKQAPACP